MNKNKNEKIDEREDHKIHVLVSVKKTKHERQRSLHDSFISFSNSATVAVGQSYRVAQSLFTFSNACIRDTNL